MALLQCGVLRPLGVAAGQLRSQRGRRNAARAQSARLNPCSADAIQPLREILEMDISTLREWLEYRFVRSPGPGGQNVNKVSTAVVLLFDFESCPHVKNAQRERLRHMCATRLAKDGRLRVSARKHRTQGRNRHAAEQRLLELLKAAAHAQPPRRPTRPTAASRRKRAVIKRIRSERKQLRRPPQDN